MNSSPEYSAPHTGAPAQQFSVLLFAGLRDAMHCERLSISVPHPDAASTLTVADLLQACAAQYPTLSKWLPHVRVAVNLEYSHPHTPLQNGDEIAFIPPVAGGSFHHNS